MPFKSRLPTGVLLLLLAAACRPGINYEDPVQPRYGSVAPNAQPPGNGDTLRVVSFNIEYSIAVARAIGALRSEPELRSVDILLLQEMTAPAAQMIADSLGMHHVYYPAIYNRLKRRDVGNAVLSRWPIVDDAKLILPSRSRYAKTQRIATAVSIRIGARMVRVYATHLGTPADLGKAGRAAQLRAIIENAAQYPFVIIGGDMNSKDVGFVARKAGYLWPTDTIPRSNAFGHFDHFFLRGIELLDSAGAGTVGLPSGISDHKPVWIRARFR